MWTGDVMFTHHVQFQPIDTTVSDKKSKELVSAPFAFKKPRELWSKLIPKPWKGVSYQSAFGASLNSV
jgi:hypothetical protein